MIGTTISRYKILSKLGGGGMGVVYEAEDSELGRRVAIKFLPEGTASGPDALERFKREARAASALDHPHICTVFDVGTHEGQPFLVMERLKGQSLNHVIGSRGMPVDDVVRLGEQFADALDAAHRAGIVHRDLKPANLFVTERRDGKILDFGLAKVTSPEASGPVSADAATVAGEFLTEAGTMLGTVAYMSPEQARGQLVDARGDLFSLGVVLYEMATGRLPFPGDTAADLFSAILGKQPTPLREIRPEIPAKLEDAILKALEKDPALRYQTAADVRGDLLRLKRDSSGASRASALATPARDEKPPSKGKDRSGSSRGVWWGVGALAAALLAAVGYFATRGGSPGDAKGDSAARAGVEASAPVSGAAAAVSEKSIAVLPFRDLSEKGDQAYLSEGIAEDLLTLLTQTHELKVIARTSSFSFRGKDVRPAEIGRTLGVAHLLDGSVRRAGDTIRVSATLVDARSETPVWSQTFDRKLNDVFAVQDEIAQAVVRQLKLALLGRTKAIDPEAYALFLEARQLARQDSKEGYEQAIPLFQKVLATASDYAPAWDQLAFVYFNQASAALRPRQEGMRLTQEAITKTLEIDPLYATAHSRRGLLALRYTPDLAEAAWHIERALELDPENAVVVGHAARLAVTLGRLDLALAVRKHALALDPLSVTGHSNLAHIYRLQGRFDDSIATWRSGLRLSPDRTGAWANLGVVLALKGDGAAALEEIRKEQDEPSRLWALAIAYRSLGRSYESEAALAELERKYEAVSAFDVAMARAYRNEPDLAFAWLDKARRHEDPNLSNIAVETLFDNVRSDARWLSLLRELGKAPEQLAKIEFHVPLPLE